MVLLNALCMHAKWKYPLDANTFSGTFTMADGKSVEAEFMQGAPETLTYIQHAGARGVILPYENEDLAFLALLPAPGETVRQLAARLPEDVYKRQLLASSWGGTRWPR